MSKKSVQQPQSWVFRIARWTIAGLCFLGIIGLTSAPIPSLSLITIGLITLPATHRILTKIFDPPVIVWWAISLSLFFVVTLTAPEQTVNNRIDPRVISRTRFGDAWPLTVEEGRLNCEGQNGIGIATITANGTTYAVNGLAQGHGYPRIDPIWRDHPTLPGAKVNLRPVLDAALALCN